MPQIQYISASEAAEKWGISHRRVITLCRENRIPNVAMLGNMWIIPRDAKKPTDGRTMKTESSAVAKPFIKWAGGKGQLLPELRKFYPSGLGVKIRKYCEPMVGAGAVLFDLLNKYDMDEVLINDTNAELINAFKEIKHNSSHLICSLENIEKEYLKLDESNRKKYYYVKREYFNTLTSNPLQKNSIERAILFIFLNKTCFNGLYRVNRNGEFNVPMGSYKKPTICDKENLLNIAEKIQKVEMISGDYTIIDSFVDQNTFIYFDPPYRPLTRTASFTAYTPDNFDDKQQIRLATYINELSKRNVKVMASNSDPKNVDENDSFFDDLYKGMNIYRLLANRSINSNGKERGKIKELLITNY